MKKNGLLLIGTILIATTIFAQKKYDLVANATCECIKAKENELKNSTIDKWKMQIGVCMLSAYNKYQSQFGKSEKLLTNNGEFNDAVAEKIGIAMAIACPDIVMAMTKEDEKSNTATTNEKYAVEEKFSTKVVGTFNGLVTDEYINVVVTDESGKKQSLIWFEYFPNADWFIENMEKLKNKKLTIYYTEKEVYSSKLKKHIIQKVINNIEEKSE